MTNTFVALRVARTAPSDDNSVPIELISNRQCLTVALPNYGFLEIIYCISFESPPEQEGEFENINAQRLPKGAIDLSLVYKTL